MPWHDVDEFLNEVCKHIKYKGAHLDVTDELQNHIRDHMDDFIGRGMDEETAVRMAVEAMGDPVEIGNSLNKLHKHYLGWILSITDLLIVIAILWTSLIIGFGISSSFGSFSLMPKSENIVYSVNVNEKDKIDSRTVVIKEVVLDKSGRIYIRYNDYSTPFSLGQSMMDFQVYDDKGNTYLGGGSQSKEAFFSRSYLRYFDNWDKNAKKLIIDYDHYNRRMRFEIPLGGGGSL